MHHAHDCKTRTLSCIFWSSEFPLLPACTVPTNTDITPTLGMKQSIASYLLIDNVINTHRSWCAIYGALHTGPGIWIQCGSLQTALPLTRASWSIDLDLTWLFTACCVEPHTRPHGSESDLDLANPDSVSVRSTTSAPYLLGSPDAQSALTSHFNLEWDKV